MSNGIVTGIVTAYYDPDNDYMDAFKTTTTCDLQPETLKNSIDTYKYFEFNGVKRKITGYEITYSDAYGCDVVRFSLGEIIDGV
jgi:hypothetical protein